MESPVILIIDYTKYPSRVKESKLKSSALGGAIGLFLTLIFLGARHVYIVSHSSRP